MRHTQPEAFMKHIFANLSRTLLLAVLTCITPHLAASTVKLTTSAGAEVVYNKWSYHDNWVLPTAGNGSFCVQIPKNNRDIRIGFTPKPYGASDYTSMDYAPLFIGTELKKTETDNKYAANGSLYKPTVHTDAGKAIDAGSTTLTAAADDNVYLWVNMKSTPAATQTTSDLEVSYGYALSSTPPTAISSLIGGTNSTVVLKKSISMSTADLPRYISFYTGGYLNGTWDGLQFGKLIGEVLFDVAQNNIPNVSARNAGTQNNNTMTYAQAFTALTTGLTEANKAAAITAINNQIPKITIDELVALLSDANFGAIKGDVTPDLTKAVANPASYASIYLPAKRAVTPA